ncbi:MULTISPECIES: sensor histidine kinase [Streptomyces]|uniref:histidine kinase n=4 Tax=Streptomyces griseus TaxID=1911 RepID=B1W047_STRGG|nr:MULTISPECIES: sensor histidine kinase [Streptomyces]MYR11108.1 PAS domain-containing protein [Streptomyces sp. SID724]MYR49759.1 PAS domain-containing protein [Streptomyces sp. SID4928]EGE41703.1 signal transduction histidine kinase regulating citrate/malate metabolism [Streptomyces sp. ACT-1]SED35658.1 Sensor histidine kinase regulating citrate/malate metabolism [Streptomyces griseus]BAG18936.1 putative two-component system sensor kinase [Streptomyces griseus subsp. griseus NBRC 13350]
MRLTRTLPRSLAGQLFAMQVVLIAAVVAGCAVFAYVSGSAQAEETAARQVRVAALAVADSPSVREAIRTPDPSAVLQPYAERVREDTGIAFVTIMDTERVRWTHPDEEQIGDTFLGNTAKALRGQTFAETYTGTLGPSIRVVTPIRDDGRIVGLVSAGITVDRVSSQVRDQLGALALAAGGALALGGAGTYVINARLRRHTHGMNAAELSRLHDYHQATLHAVREGLLMLDGRRRIALVNDAGRELLGLEPDAEAVGRTVDELALPAPLTGALLASEARVDELHLTADRVVVVNTRPVVGGERRGTVVTLRDHTELQALTGELDSERGFTQALRSQAHEAANRLHTVVSLIELGRVEEAVDFATAELELAQVLTDRVVGAVEEPVLAALLLGKAAQANERGVELVLAEDSLIDDGALPASLAQRDLVTILGNLIDNAVEAASDGADGGSDDGSGAVPAPRAPGGPAGRARVTVTALADERELLLRVADTGAGIGPEAADEVFRRGWSTHGSGRGLGLALVRQAAYRNGGTVELDAGPDGGARFTVRLPLGDRTAAGVRAKEVTA